MSKKNKILKVCSITISSICFIVTLLITLKYQRYRYGIIALSSALMLIYSLFFFNKQKGRPLFAFSVGLIVINTILDLIDFIGKSYNSDLNSLFNEKFLRISSVVLITCAMIFFIVNVFYDKRKYYTASVSLLISSFAVISAIYSFDMVCYEDTNSMYIIKVLISYLLNFLPLLSIVSLKLNFRIIHKSVLIALSVFYISYLIMGLGQKTRITNLILILAFVHTICLITIPPQKNKIGKIISIVLSTVFAVISIVWLVFEVNSSFVYFGYHNRFPLHFVMVLAFLSLNSVFNIFALVSLFNSNFTEKAKRNVSLVYILAIALLFTYCLIDNNAFSLAYMLGSINMPIVVYMLFTDKTTEGINEK